MKRVNEKIRRTIRWVFGAFSVTAVAFVFQACYGPAPSPKFDVMISGKVFSSKTGDPISKIKVTLSDQPQYVETEEDGSFRLFDMGDSPAVEYTLHFVDESEDNGGVYLPKDTLLRTSSTSWNDNINIYLDEE